MENHQKSKLHQAKLVTTSSCQCKQTYIQLDRGNFKEKLVSLFLTADIPLHKLNYPALTFLFAAMKKLLPTETAARASVAQLASQKEENIRKLFRNKKVFLIVDEEEVDKQKYINVLVGSLDTPNETFLIECLSLKSRSNVYSSIILHTMDDVLQQLETKRENFALLLADATRYISLASKTLKKLYPTLMHVTCIAHFLHNCIMRVRAFFKNIHDVVATIRAATIKNNDLKNDFREAGLPSPPVPVITRWANWLRAALYYSKNLPSVRTIVSNWMGEGFLVSRAKKAINVDGLVPDMVCINQYRTLTTNVELLEASDCTMTKAYDC